VNPSCTHHMHLPKQQLQPPTPQLQLRERMDSHGSREHPGNQRELQHTEAAQRGNQTAEDNLPALEGSLKAERMLAAVCMLAVGIPVAGIPVVEGSLVAEGSPAVNRNPVEEGNRMLLQGSRVAEDIPLDVPIHSRVSILAPPCFLTLSLDHHRHWGCWDLGHSADSVDYTDCSDCSDPFSPITSTGERKWEFLDRLSVAKREERANARLPRY